MSEALIKIATGRKPAIPAGWEAKAELIGLCLAGERRCAVWPAILVAAARTDFATPQEWLAACCERFGWDRPHVHHMRSVGALVDRAPSDARITLMGCSFNVLFAMTPLPTNLIGPFCEKVDVRGLTRDQVRDHVATWMGTGKKTAASDARNTRKAAGQGAQLDFLGSLFAATARPMDAEQRRELAASDRVRPVVAMINGLSLVSVATEKYSLAPKVDSTELEEAIDELEQLAQRLRDRLAGHPQLEA